MKTRPTLLIGLAAIAIGAVAAAWFLLRPAAEAPPAEAPAVAVRPIEQAPAATASEPAVKFPLQAASAPELAAGDIGAALIELLGRQPVLSFFQTDNFAQRFVATVDNLGREHAPANRWPVNPTPGRFTVRPGAQGTVIDADNAARYTPFVLLAESVDAARAADFYLRLYPLLQHAYEALGFPGRYFNDRLVAVIDLLLATPEPAGPLPVVLTEVKGPIASQRPWVRYQYADPALESLAAGQKMLLRMGAANEKRLKLRLAAFREEIARRSGLPR